MNIDFAKYSDGLVPTIVQDASTDVVLMLGFMNADALAATEATGRVTFYSRSKLRLWTKGETSGNYLDLVSIVVDCDSDTLLVRARPNGPVCHTGSATCFGDQGTRTTDFLQELEAVIQERRDSFTDGSYVSKLFLKGINKIAQKVGEEAVETVIAAKDDDPEAFKGEAADLLFHFLILLHSKGMRLDDIVAVLRERRR